MTELIHKPYFELLLEESNESSGYGPPYSKTVRVGRTALLEVLNEQISGFRSMERSKETPLISTKVSPLNSWKYYLMTLDCDSVDNMKAAEDNLKYRGLKYYVIESSPEKFWIVTSLVGSISEIINSLQYIPGCDSRYARLAKERNECVLRAIPKNGFLPIFPKEIVGDEVWVNWLKELYLWWKEPTVLDYAKWQGKKAGLHRMDTYFNQQKIVKFGRPRLLRPSLEVQ